MADETQAERPMAGEHRWEDEDGEKLRVTDTGGWYQEEEGGAWRSANKDWISRYIRYELLRVVAERDEARQLLVITRAERDRMAAERDETYRAAGGRR